MIFIPVSRKLFLLKRKTMNRKKFLFTISGSTAGLVLLHNTAGSQVPSQQEAPPPLPAQLVKEFVGAGHKDLSKVQAMVAAHPNLVHSKYDWGNGDFEEAIEGAGHVGNKEIAQYLIDAGSRVTLFVLAMLGRTELVKPVLESYPKLVFANGPHGFTLLHHAKLAGKEGEPLYNYLQEKGLKETWVKIK
jgi:hypothetical protein